MSGLEPLLMMATTAASAAAPYAGLAGAGISALGTIAAGNTANELAHAEERRLQAEGIAAKQAADYEAKQLDMQAKEERAAAQREAFALGRQKRLALSKLQATGAASGFTATDPSSLAIADEIEKYGTYQEQMAMYGGQSRGSSLEASAEGRRYSGQVAQDQAFSSGAITKAAGVAKRNASYFDAAGTILGGISGFGEKYAKRKPISSSSGRYG